MFSRAPAAFGQMGLTECLGAFLQTGGHGVVPAVEPSKQADRAHQFNDLIFIEILFQFLHILGLDPIGDGGGQLGHAQGGPFGSSRVLAYYMFEVALSEYGFRMGYGAAIAVVLFLIMLCFITYFLWSMYREEKGH